MILNIEKPTSTTLDTRIIPNFCPWCLEPIKLKTVNTGFVIKCDNKKCHIQPYTYASSSINEVIRWWNEIYKHIDKLALIKKQKEKILRSHNAK